MLDIIESNENDFRACKASEKFLTAPIGSNNEQIFLKVTKIPYTAKEDTIRSFFKNYCLAENGIRTMTNKKGNLLDKAVIAFADQEECWRALEEKNGMPLPMINQ